MRNPGSQKATGAGGAANMGLLHFGGNTNKSRSAQFETFTACPTLDDE
jgi:hypothetical protein